MMRKMCSSHHMLLIEGTSLETDSNSWVHTLFYASISHTGSDQTVGSNSQNISQKPLIAAIFNYSSILVFWQMFYVVWFDMILIFPVSQPASAVPSLQLDHLFPNPDPSPATKPSAHHWMLSTHVSLFSSCSSGLFSLLFGLIKVF